MFRNAPRRLSVVLFALLLSVAVLSAVKFGHVTLADLNDEAATPAPLFPVGVSATKSAALAPGGDVNGNGFVNSGDTLAYTVVVSNSGADALNTVFTDQLDANLTLVGGTLEVSPIAVNDAYSSIGNVGISIPAGSGVLANDISTTGAALTVTLVNATSVPGTAATTNGSVTMNADGSFTYTPNAGFAGPTDTFTYTVGNGTGLTDTATVTITVSNMIWFVNASAGVNGDGRLTSPFNCLNGSGCYSSSANAAGDTIFLYSSGNNYTGGIILKNNQFLIGQGANASISTITGITVPAGSLALPATNGTNSGVTVLNASGNAVTLAQGNNLNGFTTGNSSGPGISGTTFGTVTVNNVAINSTGQALALNTGTFAGTGLTSTTSTGGIDNVVLNFVAGTVALNSGTMSGATSSSFVVSSGNPTVTYSGTITQNNAARVVDIQGTSGNTVTLSGTITAGASSTGVHIGDTATVNGNVSFTTLNLGTSGSRMSNQAVTIDGGTGTYGLGAVSIFTNNAQGIVANNANGTINATGTVDSSNATAIFISGPAGITTLGMNLTSVNSAGGTADGIFLQNTNGSFTINGDGSDTSVGGNSTGGTIANKSGTDGTSTQGIGIYLNDATNITLRRMTINGTNQNYGIKAYTVSGFTMEYSTVSGTNGTSASVDTYGEGSVFFGNASTNGVSGTVTFTNDSISGGRERNLSIVNGGNSSTTTTLTVKGCTFGAMLNNSDGNQSFAVEERHSGSTFNTTFGGTNAGEPNTLTNAVSDLVNFTGQTGTTMDVVMRNNALSNNNPDNIIGGGSLNLSTQGSMTFHVTGNTMRDANGSAVTLFKASSGTLLSGFFDSNTIGVAAVTDSGSKTGNGIFVSAAGTGTMSYTITNNTIQQYHNNAAIWADNTGGSYTANFDIRHNTIGPFGPGTFAGIAITNGANTSSDTINVCAKIGGSTAADQNTLNVAGQLGIIVGSSGQNGGHTFNLPGYPGGGTFPTNVQNFIQGNNTGSFTTQAYDDNGANGVAFTGNAGCGTPLSRPEPTDEIAPPPIEDSTAPDIQTTLWPLDENKKTVKPDYMTPLARQLYLLRYGVPYEDPQPQSKPQPQVENNMPAGGPTNDAARSAHENAIVRHGTSVFAYSYGLPGDLFTVIAQMPRGTARVEDRVFASGTALNATATGTVDAMAVSDITQTGPGFLAEITGKLVSAIAPTVSAQGFPIEKVKPGKNSPQSGELITVNGGGSGFTLPSGKSFTVEFNATIDPAYTQTSIDNQANVTAAGGININSNNLSTPVIQPPQIAKAFGAAGIATNTGVTSLTFTITNPNPGQAFTAVAFSDTFPAGMLINTPNGLTNTCGGTPTATQNTNLVSLTGGGIAAGGSCTLKVDVMATTEGVKNNVSGTVSSLEGGTGNTASASLNVINAPSFIKGFGATTVPLNGTTSLTIILANNSAAFSLSGIGFTDTLPPGLVVASPNNLVSNCSGTATAVAASSSVSLSGASLATSASCSINLNVTGTTTGVKNNSVTLATTEFGASTATANASVTVVAPPTITKGFVPTSIPVGGTSTLSFTVTNPNTASALSGVAFTDNLPSGVVVAAPPNITGSCGAGTITAVAGSSSISLSGGTLAASPGAGSSCTFSVDVKGTTAGSKNNTTGAITSNEGGPGTTSNTATLNVEAAPYIQKSFAQSGAACVTPPTGMMSWWSGDGNANDIAGSNNGTLQGGATFGAGEVGQAFSFNGSGQFVDVPDNDVLNTGDQLTLDAWIFPTSLGGSQATAAIVNKRPVANNAGYTLELTNSNLSFSIWTANGVFRIDGGSLSTNVWQHVAATYDGSMIRLFLNGVQVNSLPVTGGNILPTTNDLLIGQNIVDGQSFAGLIDEVELFNRGLSQPEIQSIFSAGTNGKCKTASISLNGTTPLTFTITNPADNAQSLTGVGFTDTLPTGLTVANSSSTVCGGTLTTTSPTSIVLAGANIAVGGQCQFSVTVTGATAGNYTNVTGAVGSANGGTGNTASANVTVASPPSITKLFGAASIPLNGTTSLTFNINNPNTNVNLTGIAFTDTLPAGLVVATPNALTNTCGGTATAVAASGVVSLSGGALASSASCSVAINVSGTTAGVKNNAVTVTSTEGGTGNTSNASITVVAPPVIIKAFGAASIPLNGSTSLQFTIQNNNTTTTLTGVGFSDTLPGGLVVSTPNGLTGSCGGGTITATQNTSVISLTGATLAQSTFCTFSVNVTGTAAGTQNNTTGNVTSTEGGTGGTASASIDVVAPPTINKAFGAAAVSLNGTTSLTFTITNPAANGTAESGIAFTDTLPAGLVVASPSGLTTTCGGTAVAGSGSVSLTGGTIATPGNTCTVTVNVTGTTSGIKNNSVTVSSTNGGTGNTSNASLTVASPPTITKLFGAASIPLNGTTSLTFNINNPNTNVNLTGIAFTDTLPAGLVVATPNALTNTCGGTATAVAASGSVSLAGGTLASGASCSVSVNVTGTTVGVKNNSVQVTSSEGGTGNTSNASITVVGPPVIIKAFGAASIPLNGSTSLQFTIQNNNTTTTLTGVGFSDTLPGGLVVSTPNGLTGSCGGGTITATQNTNVISLSGATLAQSTFCTFSVNVTGTAAGTKNNTTGNVTSTEGGTGGTASASIIVVAPPSIQKAFNPTLIPVNGTTTLTLTITNPAANTVAETGVAFTDTLPTGLVVSTPNGLSNTCGGTATAVAGTTSISLTGGSVAVGSSCTVVVNVKGTASGTYTNTTGAVSSTNGGTGNTASANLTVDSPPTASATSPNVVLGGGATQTVTVTYVDDNAVKVSTLDSNDITVTGPGGFNATATFVNVNNNTDGTPRIATYTIVPPGGTWDIGDNGTYNIVMQPNQVTDNIGQPVAPGTIGTFTVNIPPVAISGNIQQYVPGGPNTNLAGVTVTLTSSNVPVPAPATTDAGGNYSFTGLSSGGSYVVTASMAGKVPDPLSRTLNSLTTNVTNANFVMYNVGAIPRIFSIPTSYVIPGQMVSIPIDVASQGTEAFMAFSLAYDSNLFTGPVVTCGSSDPGCVVTFTNPSPGVLGVTITPAAVLNAGPREIARITLTSFTTTATSSPITFTDTPTVRLVKNVTNDPLPAVYTNGLVVFAQGLEGDIATRFTGDGQLLSNDVTLVRQFVVGLAIPNPAFNEFQRADCAPRGTSGDGQIDAADTIQTRRYVAGLDPLQPAAGPGAAPTPALGPIANEGRVDNTATNRTIQITSSTASPGSKATVSVEMTGTGKEAATSFTLNFDASKLVNPVISLGSGAPATAILTTNLKAASDGKVAVLVDSTEAFVGSQVVTITFDVAPNAAGGDTPLAFTNDLAVRSTSDTEANPLATKYTDGTLTISGPAQAGYQISGRVLVSNDQGLRNASVTLTDAKGTIRTVTTSTFGYYSFDNVATGDSYTIAVESKRYVFQPRTIQVAGNLSDVDLTASQ